MRLALELFPTRKRETRTEALRALAKEIDCDASNIDGLLRNELWKARERRRVTKQT